jgi:LPS O-antigen subunit length determinant protein (WzzB/FepE family)
MSGELDPLQSLKNLLRHWWKIILIAYVFSLVGLVASYLMPAKYQAGAVFSSSIDFTQINFENLSGENEQPLTFTQYDEDLAVQVVQRFLIQEQASALAFAKTLDSSIDAAAFNRDSQIQRYHAEWYLRYRHANPEIAQQIVNYWANEAFEALQAAQANGQAESFVIVDLVAEAPLPQEPLYHNRATLVLSGALIGLILGVLVVDGRIRFGKRTAKEV